MYWLFSLNKSELSFFNMTTRTIELVTMPNIETKYMRIEKLNCESLLASIVSIKFHMKLAEKFVLLQSLSFAFKSQVDKKG